MQNDQFRKAIWILGEANEAAASGPLPFFGVVEEPPLLKMACAVLGYVVAF